MGLYVPGAARMAAASVGAHIDRLGSSVRCIHVSFQRDDLPRGCDVIQLSNTKTHGICVVVSILLAYVSDRRPSARITSYHIGEWVCRYIHLNLCV